MKTKLLILFGLTAIAFFSQCDSDNLTDCIKGHGNIENETRNFEASIHGVQYNINGNLHVRPGNANEIRIEAQENIIENIETKISSNNILRIEFDKCVKNYSSIEIYATIPYTEYFGIEGSGDIFGPDDTLFTNSMELSIDGSGDIHLVTKPETPGLESNIHSSITGSGSIELRGKTDNHFISITGSGDINSYILETNSTYIDITGSGNCEVFVNELLDVEIEGSGNVFYKGYPEVRTKISGSGVVVDKN